MVLEDTIWSPVLHNCNSVGVIAPMPEAATLAVSVPSIAARASPRFKLLGLE